VRSIYAESLNNDRNTVGAPTYVARNVNQKQEGYPKVQLPEKSLLHDRSVLLILVCKSWAITSTTGRSTIVGTVVASMKQGAI